MKSITDIRVTHHEVNQLRKADALVISAPSVNPPHHTDRPQRNDEDAVSAYMSQAYIRVTVSDTIAAVKRTLREELEGEQIPTYLYVLDEDNYLNGILPVKTLLTAAEDMFVADVMRQTYFSVSPEQSRTRCTSLSTTAGLILCRWYSSASWPVFCVRRISQS